MSNTPSEKQEKKDKVSSKKPAVEKNVSVLGGFLSILQNSVFLSNIITLTLVFLLMMCMFVIGSLWTRVTYNLTDKNLNPTAQAPSNNLPSNPSAQPTVSPLSNLTALAKKAGVDTDKFDKCLADGTFKDKVKSDQDKGGSAGVQGTPGNFLVNVKNNKVIQIPGAVPYENLKVSIDKLLSDTATDEELFKGKLPEITKDDHRKGADNATIVLVEYSDFQCPYCIRFHSTALQALNEYSDQMAWVYRHFPLDQIHPYARSAAEASECVASLGGNDAFWKFVDATIQ